MLKSSTAPINADDQPPRPPKDENKAAPAMAAGSLLVSDEIKELAQRAYFPEAVSTGRTALSPCMAGNWGACAKKSPCRRQGRWGALDQMIQRSGGTSSLDAAAKLAAEAESCTSTQDGQGARGLTEAVCNASNGTSVSTNCFFYV